LRVGLHALTKLGKVVGEIHLVIGLGDNVEAGTYPILTISQNALAALSMTSYEFKIHADDKISIFQVGLG
jgi:hypothetical protein